MKLTTPTLCLALLAALLLIAAPSATADPQSDCYERCADEFDICELRCDPYGGPTGCTTCYEQFNECKDFCDECPVSNDTVDTTIDSTTQLSGTLCLWDPYGPSDRNLFQKHDVRFKQTTTRVTQQCDGSVTSTVINVSYYNQICWYDTNATCFYAVDHRNNYCTFN